MVPKVPVDLLVFPRELRLPRRVFPHLVHDLVARQIIALLGCLLCRPADLTPEECPTGRDIELVFALRNRGGPVRPASGDLVAGVFSCGYPVFLDEGWGLTGDASTSRLLAERMTARAFRGFERYIAQVFEKDDTVRSYKAKTG